MDAMYPLDTKHHNLEMETDSYILLHYFCKILAREEKD